MFGLTNSMMFPHLIGKHILLFSALFQRCPSCSHEFYVLLFHICLATLVSPHVFPYFFHIFHHIFLFHRFPYVFPGFFHHVFQILSTFHQVFQHFPWSSPIEPRSAPGACATSPADAPTAAAPGATRSAESAASKNGFGSWV